MSNRNVKWTRKEHKGMQHAPEIGQQNASQQPTTLMQPTHILAHHSAYLQVISSIDTSKKNPSTMMTSLMPMPYTGVLWWNPPCIQTLVHQPLSRSHATAHKYIWHPRPWCLCSVSLAHLQCSMDPWKRPHLAAGSHFTHQSNPAHLCSVSLARLQHSMDPRKCPHLAAGSHFTHQSNPAHWKGMILDIVVLHRSIYTQIGELVFIKVDRIIYSLSSTFLATIRPSQYHGAIKVNDFII